MHVANFGNWKSIFSKLKSLCFLEVDEVFDNHAVDVLDEFKYLGILFSRIGPFNQAKWKIVKQTTLAMFCLLRKSRTLNLPAGLQIYLFNKTILRRRRMGLWLRQSRLIDNVKVKFLKQIKKNIYS